jgi:hypothetical protein
MPWYGNRAAGGAYITTDGNNGGWWGTLITPDGWNPAPWMGQLGTTGGYPGIIWYWVR